MPDQPLIASQNDFAALCGVSRQAISDWIGEGMPGVTKPARNRMEVDVFLALPWVRMNKWTPALDDRARKLRAEADKAELEVAKMRGSLVDAEDVRRTWEGFLAALRTNLMGYPDRTAPLLEEEMTVGQRVAILREELYKVLVGTVDNRHF